MLDGSAMQPLVDLGFTALEAEAYSFLLQESPVTGYRIAQALRRPAPNVYKALESLELKGAVLVEDADNRLCRPVPPGELLAHLERRFREHRGRAERLLSEVTAPPADDRVYTLRSPDQVMERARRMLARGEVVAMVDAFPIPLEELRTDLEATAARGVQTAVKAYSPIGLEGVRVVLDPDRNVVTERWPGQWVNLVVDGREHMVAFLSSDGSSVQQAVWSGSAYLSWVYHSAMASEIGLDAVRNRLDEGASVGEIRGLLEEVRTLTAMHAPGYQELSRRFADAGPRARRGKGAGR